VKLDAKLNVAFVGIYIAPELDVLRLLPPLL
jgi:hypothetical protein